MADEELEEKRQVEKISQEEMDEFGVASEIALHTHEMLDSRYSGELLEIKEGYAKVSLQTSQEMVADKYGLVHGGFIFSAADFAAMAAVNAPYVVLSGAVSKFLAPVRVDDMVVFVAKARHADGRRREVNVVGHVLEIKVFEATFKTVVLENHALQLNLMKIGTNEND